jgi:hypothetical protein
MKRIRRVSLKPAGFSRKFRSFRDGNAFERVAVAIWATAWSARCLVPVARSMTPLENPDKPNLPGTLDCPLQLQMSQFKGAVQYGFGRRFPAIPSEKLLIEQISTKYQ